jgi:hypothetical protein
MSLPLPLRFVAHTTDPVMLICEGSVRPAVGQRVRATASEGNGLLVVEVVGHDQLPEGTELRPETFGLRLKYNVIPWPPNTPIEVIGR